MKHSTDLHPSRNGVAPLVFDPAWLALPLWEDHHRALAARLQTWVTQEAYTIHALAARPVEDAAKALVALLARDGWLEVATGYRDGVYAPDFRAICLCRAAFAFVEDLCDFAFAIQGLAAYPLATARAGDRLTGYLDALRTGAAIGAFALSEPQAGSDLASITTQAVPTEHGFSVSGEKTWIGNAGIADVICVLARTGGPKAMGLSLFALSADQPGLTQTGGIVLAAPRAFGSVLLEDCAVPADAVIGAQGLGFALAVDTLDKFRMTVGAAAIGFARRAALAAITHVKTREVDGGALAQTQLIKTGLARMATEITTAQLVVAQAAWEIDTHQPSGGARSAMAKYQATEAAQQIIDTSLQMHGAAGCVAGSLPEQLYRQIRSSRIYEGTSEIQQLVIGDAVLSGTVLQ